MTASLLQSIMPKFILPEDCFHYLSINRIIKNFYIIFQIYSPSLVFHYHFIIQIYLSNCKFISLFLSQELGSRLQQIGDVTKALEVLLYCLELDRGIVSHSEFDPNAEFEANDPRGRLFASSKGRGIIAESLKQVVQSR